MKDVFAVHKLDAAYDLRVVVDSLGSSILIVRKTHEKVFQSSTFAELHDEVQAVFANFIINVSNDVWVIQYLQGTNLLNIFKVVCRLFDSDWF